MITDYHPSSNLAVLAPAQFSHKLKVVLGIGVLSLDDKRGTQQTRQFDIFSGIYRLKPSHLPSTAVRLHVYLDFIKSVEQKL